MPFGRRVSSAIAKETIKQNAYRGVRNEIRLIINNTHYKAEREACAGFRSNPFTRFGNCNGSRERSKSSRYQLEIISIKLRNISTVKSRNLLAQSLYRELDWWLELQLTHSIPAMDDDAAPSSMKHKLHNYGF